MVTIFGKEDGDRVTDKVGDKVGDNLTKNQNLILSVIQTNQTISALELSKRIGISKRKIEENMRKLKDLGILKRIGPAKGGHWEIR
jgi:ATP-dependent DNA helicase RecG